MPEPSLIAPLITRLAWLSFVEVVDDLEVAVAPVEYVIVRKLEYFREGRSGKHVRDIH